MIGSELVPWQTRHILRRNPMVRIVGQTHPRREIATEGALTPPVAMQSAVVFAYSSLLSARSSQPLYAPTISQVKVFEDVLAVATGHRRTARATWNIVLRDSGPPSPLTT